MSGPNDQLSFVEPFGHAGLESKLERYWRSVGGRSSLTRHRVTQYSGRAGMTYAPMQYVVRQFELSSDTPNDQWIADSLVDFVRNEFSSKTPSLPSSWPPKVEEVVHAPANFLDNLLSQSEIIGNLDVGRFRGDTSPDTAASIYELLCDVKVGSTKNREYNDKQQFIEKLLPAIEDRSRLLFVLPGFPFKDQNRFRVPFEAHTPDLADIAFLIRLHRLALAMYQVHPYGVDVLVLTDGLLYNDIFGVRKADVAAYKKRLQTYRNKLNFQGTVSFIDLKELIDRANPSSGEFNLSAHIEGRLAALNRKPPSKDCEDALNSLVAGMKWNMNTRSAMGDVPDDVCWSVLRGDISNVGKKYRSLYRTIDQQAQEAALRYASINLMLRWTNLLERSFPGAIRGTVHAKPGQFALAGSGGAYAWNGVAVCKQWPSNIDEIQVKPFLSLGEVVGLKQVVFEESSSPCFYTGAATMRRNISCAPLVLPREGWSFSGLWGRELSASDLHQFTALGSDDPLFAWERTQQPSSYFQHLLEFRLRHYSKYGFGVHGVWQGGVLVGQVGLQVFDEEKDQVEIAMFLGRSFIHKGLGTRLMSHVLRRCREVGMDRIFGVLRPENVEATSLVEKFSFTLIGPTRHFEEDALIYRLDLQGSQYAS